MIRVKQQGVVITRGYRLETSEKHENELELAFYERGKRSFVDSIPASSIKNYQDAWRFIENNIGSSASCDFTEEAVKKIFEK